MAAACAVPVMLEAEKQVADARARLQAIEKAWGEAARQGPVEQLTVELEADESLRSTLQRDAAQSEILLAENDARRRFAGASRDHRSAVQETVASRAERSPDA